MDIDRPRDAGADGASQFQLAWWVTALFIVGFIGGSVILVLGTADLLQDAADDPVRGVAVAAFVAVSLGGLVVLPSLYYLVRRTRGVPMLTIDWRGVVLGGSWTDDLAVEWTNVRGVRLRKAASNGITDTQVLFDLADDAPLKARVRGFRQRATVAGNRLMFGVPFGFSTAYLGGGSDSVLAAIGRHYRGPITPAS